MDPRPQACRDGFGSSSAGGALPTDSSALPAGTGSRSKVTRSRYGPASSATSRSPSPSSDSTFNVARVVTCTDALTILRTVALGGRRCGVGGGRLTRLPACRAVPKRFHEPPYFLFECVQQPLGDAMAVVRRRATAASRSRSGAGRVVARPVDGVHREACCAPGTSGSAQQRSLNRGGEVGHVATTRVRRLGVGCRTTRSRRSRLGGWSGPR